MYLFLSCFMIGLLDVDHRRDEDASPMSSYRCMLRPTWMFMDRMIATIHFWLLMIENLWRPLHWCIKYQCRTDIDEARVISALQNKSKFNFELFWKKKNQIFRFPCCSAREDHSIDVSITNVELILTKPGWFIFSGYGQTDTLAVDPYMYYRRTGMHNCNQLANLQIISYSFRFILNLWKAQNFTLVSSTFKVREKNFWKAELSTILCSNYYATNRGAIDLGYS